MLSECPILVFCSLYRINLNILGVKNDLQKRRESLHKERIADICYSLCPKCMKHCKMYFVIDMPWKVE
jgi:hypothetical protein